VSAQGEGGLLGLAVDPDFVHNRFVYLYYTTPGGMRLERWRFASGRLQRERQSVRPGQSVHPGRSCHSSSSQSLHREAAASRARRSSVPEASWSPVGPSSSARHHQRRPG
jgi:glucose/arabinose dehydrogenase